MAKNPQGHSLEEITRDEYEEVLESTAQTYFDMAQQYQLEGYKLLRSIQETDRKQRHGYAVRYFRDEEGNITWKATKRDAVGYCSSSSKSSSPQQ